MCVCVVRVEVWNGAQRRPTLGRGSQLKYKWNLWVAVLNRAPLPCAETPYRNEALKSCTDFKCFMYIKYNFDQSEGGGGGGSGDIRGHGRTSNPSTVSLWTRNAVESIMRVT